MTDRPKPVTGADELFYAAMLPAEGADPYDGYRALRERAPMLLTEDGTLVLSDHAGCDAALRHRALGKGGELLGFQFANVAPELLTEINDLLGDSMIFTNPPDHTRLRRLVSDQFTPRHVQALRERIERRVETMLDRLATPDGGDFMKEVAFALPMHVIADLLGIAEPDRDRFLPWARAFAAFTSPDVDTAAVSALLEVSAEADDYFTDLIARKRRDPEDDLLSRMAAARDADALTDKEMIATALLLFGAGFETTTNLLGNSLAALLDDPAQLKRLRDDPSLVPAAVEEFLRYDPPVQIDARTVLEPAVLQGVDVAPGQMVITLLAAANRDPARFTDPDTLDVGRPDNPHLSFAAGIHFCLGAHLTRLEAQIVLHRLVTAYAAVTPSGPRTRRPGLALRGHSSLPVALTA